MIEGDFGEFWKKHLAERDKEVTRIAEIVGHCLCVDFGDDIDIFAYLLYSYGVRVKDETD